MTKQQLSILFQAADRNLCINTSYPLEPAWFSPYRANLDLFQDVHSLSYYLHVPFCKSLCKYCEYTRFRAGDERAESHYVDLVEKQCETFLKSHEIGMIHGFDVGGGTPTALSLPNFKRILSLYGMLTGGVARDDCFQNSVEFSFDTITEEKVRAMAEAGFTRASAGIQAIGKWFNTAYGRPETPVEWVRRVHAWLCSSGIARLNLDLMYGFPGQSVRDVDVAMDFIAEILPEQITLYEMRYNQTGLIPDGVSRESNYGLYQACYSRLLGMGYRGRFGVNAFSRDGKAPFSSYIASRMEDAHPYKGLGISAQSMTDRGLSYNTLKGSRFSNISSLGQIGAEDIYLLPGRELVAKYVSIALYGGSFNLRTIFRLLGESAEKRFTVELEYLLGNGLAHIDGEVVLLTERGIRYAGAIGVLFWPEARQKDLIRVQGMYGGTRP